MTGRTHPSPTLAELRDLPSVVGFLKAATFHGISRPQAYRLLATDRLPFEVHRVGDRYRVRTAELAVSLGVDPALLLTADA